MKKAVWLIIAFVFLLSSTGVFIKIHWCGKSFAHIEITGLGAKSGCCSGEKKSACCKNTIKYVKLKDAFQVSKTQLKSFGKSLVVLHHSNPSFIFSTKNIFSCLQETTAYTASIPPPYVRFCILRI